MKLKDKSGKEFSVRAINMSRADMNKVRGKSLEEARRLCPAITVKAVK